jgi:peptidoglycan/LPS O-acetylase OafA/YrhL
MSALTDTMSWGLILGVVLPLLTALVQQPTWPKPVRAAVGLAAAVLGGFVTCLANGTIDHGQTLLATIAAVLVAAQATYKGFYQPTGIGPAVEVASSPKSTQARRNGGLHSG